MSTTPGEHTPGPWIVDLGETYNIRDCATEGIVAQIHFLRGRMGLAGRIPPEQGAANARLIAASPDLLAAAKAALAVIISLDIYKKYEPVIAQLQTAIGRAEG